MQTIIYGDPMFFSKNLNEAMCALYPDCEKFTVLRFVVKMFKLKVKHSQIDISFTKLFQLLKIVLPCDNKIPDNIYQAEN